MRYMDIGDLVVSRQLVLPLVRQDMTYPEYKNSIMLVVGKSIGSKTFDVFSRGKVFYDIQESDLMVICTVRT